MLVSRVALRKKTTLRFVNCDCADVPRTLSSVPTINVIMPLVYCKFAYKLLLNIIMTGRTLR